MYQLTKGTNMTIKQQAMLQTFAIFVGIVGGSLLMNILFFYTPVFVIQCIATVILIVTMVCVVYGVVLSRFEYDAKLKELISSKT
jgi:ABC-type protease/lipase transport system fused ATPase/permease subunit